MIRSLAAVALAVHGLIHLIGFVVPWRIAELEGFPYRTTALGDTLVLGETGVRVVGVAWLVLAVGFVVAGLGVRRRDAWAIPLTAVLALASIVVCALGLPESIAGIVVNVVILGVAVVTFVQPAGLKTLQ
jgi:hypothetical protein